MTEKRHEWISSTEAAHLLGEDPRTVQRKAKAGTYTAQKLPGLRGAYIFNRADIEALLSPTQEVAS